LSCFQNALVNLKDPRTQIVTRKKRYEGVEGDVGDLEQRLVALGVSQFGTNDFVLTS